MIISFADDTTCDIFNGRNSKFARKCLGVDLHRVAKRKLDMINAAVSLDDIRVPPSNRLEMLKGSLKKFYSIRINKQYRIIFQWTEKGAENVQILDYH